MHRQAIFMNCVAASAALAFGVSHADAQSLVIGGFSTARGGVLAIQGGAALTQLRASISIAFPQTTYSGAAVLTPEYLSGIDILFISSASSGSTAIVPLSADEISAVRTFVDRGGTAVLVADNDSYAGGGTDAANESVLDPVGIDVTGTGSPWAQSATIADPQASPVTSGPFGTVSTWTVGWTGWFNVVPAQAQVLGVVDEVGLPGLVVFPRHALAACSGAVVAYSDVSAFYDGYFAKGSANDRLMLNTIAYVAAPTCQVGQCGDVNADGQVDGADLGALLGGWGTSDRNVDLDANGNVDGADLGILLGNWGQCSG